MFKTFIRKIKEQCTMIRRTGAEKEKKTIKSKSKYSFFKSRWNIDEKGLAHFGMDEPVNLISKLSALFNEESFGTVFEPYYDTKKHKRYYVHPACSIKGFEYLGSTYLLEQCPSHMPHGLILTRVCKDESVEIGNFELLKYVQFDNFCPILETERLAYDICKAILLFLDAITKEEEQSFDIYRESCQEYCSDTHTSMFLLRDNNGQNYYSLTPYSGEWNADEIYKKLVDEAPEGTHITVNWNDWEYISLREYEQVTPVVPVIPVNNKGGGPYKTMALLSLNLAKMVGDLI